MTELVEWEKSGKLFIGTPQQFVNELTYANYKYNRQCSPIVTGWETIFGAKTPLMEARYQAELKTNA